MLFTLVDLILIVAVLVFVIMGLAMGLIAGVGAIVGLVAGVWVAGAFFQPFGEWLTPFFLGHAIAANITAFIIIFLVVNRVVAMVFWIINKIFKLVSIIPFLGSINKLAGAVLGLVEGVLVVGLIVFVVAKFAGNISWVVDNLNDSRVAHSLVWTTSFMTNLLPDVFDKMTSIF